jgi:hypothetical protein
MAAFSGSISASPRAGGDPAGGWRSRPQFWVVNFGTARTVAPRRFGFAAGMGGQVVLLGNPRQASAFFTIPHAGFRLGLSPRLDTGLRLAPIPLPFATVGPGFGINLDAKYCFTPPGKKKRLGARAGPRRRSRAH